MCFGSRRRDSFEQPPAKLVKSQYPVKTDELSDAFGRLSIKSGPAQSVQHVPVSPHSVSVSSQSISAASSGSSPIRLHPGPVRNYSSNVLASGSPLYQGLHSHSQDSTSISASSYSQPSSIGPVQHKPIHQRCQAPKSFASHPSSVTPASNASSTWSSPLPSAPKSQRTPKFPLRTHPTCRQCGWVPKYRSGAREDNPNNNAERSYFICVKCRQSEPSQISKTSQARRRKGWITWDDAIGVSIKNPPCFCGGRVVASRQDKCGEGSNYPGGGFWTCATGQCEYISWRRDGLTNDEADGWDDMFEPWLL